MTGDCKYLLNATCSIVSVPDPRSAQLPRRNACIYQSKTKIFKIQDRQLKTSISLVDAWAPDAAQYSLTGDCRHLLDSKCAIISSPAFPPIFKFAPPRLAPPSPLPPGVYDVTSYGAVGDGVTNDTQAFSLAFAAACTTAKTLQTVTTMLVPARTFLIFPLAMAGPCGPGINFQGRCIWHVPGRRLGLAVLITATKPDGRGLRFLLPAELLLNSESLTMAMPCAYLTPLPAGRRLQVEGTIVAPADPKVYPKPLQDKGMLLLITRLNGLIISGSGLIDGRGQQWWAAARSASKSNNYIRPRLVYLDYCNNVTVQDIHFSNAAQMHLYFHRCMNVLLDNVTITAPDDSPNTDGIHFSECDHAVVSNCYLNTGDDNVSIQDGSSSITVIDTYCGHGHGISIGSLGKGGDQGCIAGIAVLNVVFNQTDNALRIKSWQGGKGKVSGVIYDNVTLINVKKAIILDQFYCDTSSVSASTCKVQPNNVAYSDISITNIRGTTRGENGIYVNCSSTVPCRQVYMYNVDIASATGKTLKPIFSNVYYGVVSNVSPPVTAPGGGLSAAQVALIKSMESYCQ
eukprot:jgi/Mesen1/10451/ME000082S09957